MGAIRRVKNGISIRPVSSSSSSTSSFPGNPFFLLFSLLLGLSCYLIGYFVGYQSNATNFVSTHRISQPEMENSIQERVEKELKRIQHERVVSERKIAQGGSVGSDTDHRFPLEMQTIAAGMAVVQRNEFAQKFDVGVPLDPPEKTNSQVLIMYNSASALPENAFSAKEAASQTVLPLLEVDEAVQNCDVLHLQLAYTHHPPRRQCTALMGNYESMYQYNFMRLPEHGPLDSALPFRLVARGAQVNGRKSHKPPPIEISREYWKILTTYLKNLDTSLSELRPLAERAAVNNTVVVMVVNLGQSELLFNFICSARSRRIETRGILVFATDLETRDLVESMGINVFYDSTNYEDDEGNLVLPKNAAKRYADKTFRMIMLAKVFCVHMTVLLGYNVLFQDVDLVWYRNPVEYFIGRTDFDLWFQDDGNHAEYYAPYSANTGFYYVRNNERTVHLFNTLLMDGGMILESKSHQITLIAILAEHASLFGLRIKIFSRDGELFPGGHAFNYRASYMRELFAGAAHPYIFHMSWTKNKDNKIKYFQQMGEWYVQDSCTNNTAEAPAVTIDKCCATEPLIRCHYRDKPSKIPCNSSPNIDKKKKSFW